MKAAKSKNSGLIDTLLAVSESARLEHLNKEAIPSFQRLVDAQASVFFRMGENGIAPLGGTYLNDMPHYVVDFKNRDPIWKLIIEADPRLNIFFPVQAMGFDRFRKSAIYHEYYRHYDAEDLCLIRFTQPAFGTPGTTGLMLFKSDPNLPFSQSDLSNIQKLLPAFEAVVRRSERFLELEREKRGLEALIRHTVSDPCLALDPKGKLLWISPLARSVLGPNFDPARHLPESLVTEAKKLGSGVLGRPAVSTPKVSVNIDIPDGRTIHADLFLWKGEGDEPAVAVFLEPDLKLPQISAISPAHGLTPAEIRVLDQLVQGYSNQKIGERLFISIETVRTHVKNILSKLNVSSRTEAVSRALNQIRS